MPKTTRKTSAQLDREIAAALASSETRLSKAHRARIHQPTNETREDERRAERHLKTLGGDPAAVYETVREAHWKNPRTPDGSRPDTGSRTRPAHLGKSKTSKTSKSSSGAKVAKVARAKGCANCGGKGRTTGCRLCGVMSGRRNEIRHLKKPASSKTSSKIDIDRIVKLFGFPEWNDIDERNSDYYWEAARGAEDPEAAERAAQDELYGNWYNAVTGVAERLFEEHGLELDPVRVAKSKRPYEFKVVPKKDWKDAANKIRETINGVGDFHFNNLREFLDSGPYTAQQAVLSHLGYVADHPRVYGSGSARSMYDAAIR